MIQKHSVIIELIVRFSVLQNKFVLMDKILLKYNDWRT